MMNKGFEVIEAKWLFDMEPSDINVVVHPQSIIHSMIEFEDGAVLAQMGCPDMRQPIQFALGFPQRMSLNNKKIDFGELASLTFEKPDTGRFPALSLAFEAIKKGGNIPCALNAANEVAASAYLKDRISFYDIPEIIEKCISGAFFVAKPSLDDVFKTDAEIRIKASEMINSLESR